MRGAHKQSAVQENGLLGVDPDREKYSKICPSSRTAWTKKIRSKEKDYRTAAEL